MILIFVVLNLPILRADNPNLYQLSSQTGAGVDFHSLRPQTKNSVPFSVQYTQNILTW